MTADPPDRFFAASDGVRLRYRDWGGNGDPVVFVHGFTSSLDGQWGKPGLVGGIAAAGWRAIAFDLRGHGQSDAPHDPRAYAGDRMGLDVHDLLDHLGIGCAHVMAYSLGAHIMLPTTIRHPGRAATLTLGGAAGRWNWTDADTRAVLEEACELEAGGITKHIIRLWPQNTPLPTAEELQTMSHRKLQRVDALALAAVKRAMPDQKLRPDEVSALKLPLLGVVGTEDPQLEAFRRLAQIKPALRLLEVAGGTHGGTPARAEFLAGLMDFLADHPVSTAKEGAPA